MKYGYMGLVDPLETVWSDGRKVTVFPDGSVQDKSTGYFIKQSENYNQQKIIEAPTNQNNQNLLFIGMFILGLVAIVSIARSK